MGLPLYYLLIAVGIGLIVGGIIKIAQRKSNTGSFNSDLRFEPKPPKNENEQKTYEPKSDEPKKGYAFISYSTQNQSAADSTRNLLNDNNIKSWMAPYDIPAGAKYAFEINNALENCSCVLLLLSKESQSSQHVEREIERAVAYNKTIIAMKLDDVELNSGFKYYIGNGQIVTVKHISARNSEMQKILSGINASIGS